MRCVNEKSSFGWSGNSTSKEVALASGWGHLSWGVWAHGALMQRVVVPRARGLPFKKKNTQCGKVNRVGCVLFACVSFMIVCVLFACVNDDWGLLLAEMLMMHETCKCLLNCLIVLSDCGDFPVSTGCSTWKLFVYNRGLLGYM